VGVSDDLEARAEAPEYRLVDIAFKEWASENIT